MTDYFNEPLGFETVQNLVATKGKKMNVSDAVRQGFYGKDESSRKYELYRRNQVERNGREVTEDILRNCAGEDSRVGTKWEIIWWVKAGMPEFHASCDSIIELDTARNEVEKAFDKWCSENPIL